MTGRINQHSADQLARASSALEAAATELTNIAQALRDSLSTAIEAPVKPTFNAPQTREEALGAHRAEHRMGVPGKIASDPELEAFIAARIGAMTYAEVVAAVKAHFPADRQTSVSAVQRWFRKRRAGPQTEGVNRQKLDVPSKSRK